MLVDPHVLAIVSHALPSMEHQTLGVSPGTIVFNHNMLHLEIRPYVADFIWPAINDKLLSRIFDEKTTKVFTQQLSNKWHQSWRTNLDEKTTKLAMWLVTNLSQDGILLPWTLQRSTSPYKRHYYYSRYSFYDRSGQHDPQLPTKFGIWVFTSRLVSLMHSICWSFTSIDHFFPW